MVAPKIPRAAPRQIPVPIKSEIVTSEIVFMESPEVIFFKTISRRLI